MFNDEALAKDREIGPSSCFTQNESQKGMWEYHRQWHQYMPLAVLKP